MNDDPALRPNASDAGQLRTDAELFRLLVQSVKDYAIFVLTPDGQVASWNAGAQAIKGYLADEIVGEHFSRFYEAEAIARGWPQHELAIARTSGRFEDEGWRMRKDGSRFWASVVITALYDAEGHLRGYAKVTRDLTARRRIEELQRTESRMNEFLAMLAHELRNPLAPMRTALNIAARAQGNASILRETHEMFARQLMHLTRMVDDLLDVSRISSGKIQLKFETVDLNEVLNERVSVVRPLVEMRRQTLELSLPAEPTYLHADPTRIAQIVSILIANAHKYTPDGGRIRIVLHHDDEHAMFEVSDDGVGIEAHLLRLVFEPFVQGERALDRGDGGLGLGLTVC